MNSSWQESIVLITSQDQDKSNFGTGFIVRRCKRAVYVVTCSHVIRDVGGREQVRIGNFFAETIVPGEPDGLDLAVLKVQGLQGKPVLNLKEIGRRGKLFETAGFRRFSNNRRTIRPLEGKLGEQVGLESRENSKRITAWELILANNSTLEPGYSGSPVLDPETGDVFGVVSDRLDGGQNGCAISIKELERVWEKIIDSSTLQQTLWGLGYESQTSLFLQIKEAAAAAFLIHGLEAHGQRWLLNRLVTQFVPHAATGQVINISLARRARRYGIEALQKELGEQLGLSTNNSSDEQIVEKVFEWCKHQNVLLVFHHIDSLAELDLQRLIKEFWLPLARRASQQEKPFNLLLFLVDYTGISADWDLPCTEKIDVQWRWESPVRSPKISKFSDQDLKVWALGTYHNLPSTITNQLPTQIQVILAESDGGVPEYVFEKICEYFLYDWYEERDKWLTL